MSLKDVNPIPKSRPKRVAIALSNPATSPATGWPVGFWRSELTHPWRAFGEKGDEEDEVKKLGANPTQGGLWRGIAAREGDHVAGQQNFSGAGAVIRAIGE